MAFVISDNPSGDFWSAMYARLRSWATWSDARCVFLADCGLAQARFESANFTSHLYHADNNCIGYKYYSLSSWQDGKGIASPEGDNYARYDSVSDCGGELADWIHRRKSWFDDVEDISGYLDTMSQLGYATVPVSQYAHAEQYFVATPLTDYSSDQPTVAQMVGAVALNSATSKVGEWILIAVAAFAVLSLLGVFKMLRVKRR